MIYEEKPEDFSSRFDVVSCFVEHAGEILLLHRQDSKPQGNTWGVPAGKVDNGESILETMLRELKEETGLVLAPDKLEYFGNIYVKYPDFDFVYHMFSTSFDARPDIRINSAEHKAYAWMTPVGALGLPGILDLDACVILFYKI